MQTRNMKQNNKSDTISVSVSGIFIEQSSRDRTQRNNGSTYENLAPVLEMVMLLIIDSPSNTVSYGREAIARGFKSNMPRGLGGGSSVYGIVTGPCQSPYHHAAHGLGRFV
jgi:hypothetical protein